MKKPLNNDIEEFYKREMLKRSGVKLSQIPSFENKYKNLCKKTGLQYTRYEIILILKIKEIAETVQDLKDPVQAPNWILFFKLFENLDNLGCINDNNIQILFKIYRKSLLCYCDLFIVQTKTPYTLEDIPEPECLKYPLDYKDSEFTPQRFGSYILNCCFFLAHYWSGRPLLYSKDE